MDDVAPESDTAREFAALVDRMDRAQMRVWLVRWRDNQAGIEPASGTLRRLGTIGLQALDYLERNERPPEAWLAQQRAFAGNFQEAAGRASDRDRAIRLKSWSRLRFVADALGLLSACSKDT